MSAEAGKKGAPPEADPNEDSLPSIPADPALEAALREAAAAVPEEPEPGQASELLLDEAVEPGAPEEADRLRAQVADTSDRLLRMQADFENFR
ncbi:MAG: hypothetical protein ABFS41_14570, partial [Myxococcota bacterium]